MLVANPTHIREILPSTDSYFKVSVELAITSMIKTIKAEHSIRESSESCFSMMLENIIGIRASRLLGSSMS
jgi:hypothetical protein